jgi:hypothetical protein
MSDTMPLGLSVAAIAAVAICCSASMIAQANYHNHTATCTVNSKDRGSDGNGGSNYRIYTKQCGVLADKDQWLAGKTDSADIWAQIQPGHTYRLRVVGWRVSLLSDFPNVLAVEGEVK